MQSRRAIQRGVELKPHPLVHSQTQSARSHRSEEEKCSLTIDEKEEVVKPFFVDPTLIDRPVETALDTLRSVKLLSVTGLRDECFPATLLAPTTQELEQAAVVEREPKPKRRCLRKGKSRSGDKYSLYVKHHKSTVSWIEKVLPIFGDFLGKKEKRSPLLFWLLTPFALQVWFTVSVGLFAMEVIRGVNWLLYYLLFRHCHRKKTVYNSVPVSYLTNLKEGEVRPGYGYVYGEPSLSTVAPVN